MKLLFTVLGIMLAVSCDKVISVKLPAYQPQMVVEMYLEEGKPLRCLLSQSLPYTDTLINMPFNNALVVVSDGTFSDTLEFKITLDTAAGRWYNYYHPRILSADPLAIYTLNITDSTGKRLTGTTRFLEESVSIDSVTAQVSRAEADSFSVGAVISDPAEMENYYRFMAARRFNDFDEDPADFSLSDVSFNGKDFSFYTDADYARNDTVSVRVYSLLKEHYDYMQSTDDARGSNFNPFSQPGRIKSNVTGGLGIFTTIQYDERQVIIK